MHELEVANQHVEVPSLAGETAGLGQNGTTHEDGIAHLVVAGHGWFHVPGSVEASVGGGLDQFDVTRVLGAFVQLAKDQVPGEMRTGDAIADGRLGSGSVRFDDAFDVLEDGCIVGQVAELKSADQSDCGDVDDGSEVVAVSFGELPAGFERRSSDAALEFEAGWRWGGDDGIGV